MMDFKPQVFIGSSTESKDIASKIAAELADIADCKIWTEQFEFGNSAYEDLVNKLALYDYGILVAAYDDVTKSRGATKGSPRDNVIFEFGLFAGRLGRKRSFLFAESGVKIPTDLNGITLPFYKSPRKKGVFDFRKKEDIKNEHLKSIANLCGQIKKYIESRDSIFDYGFLPSTSLAYGYFNNFILRAISNLIESKVLHLAAPEGDKKGIQLLGDGGSQSLNGMKFEDLKLTILIPDDLGADMFDKVKAHRRTAKWTMVKIDAGAFRPFDFYVHLEKSRNGVLELSDIPITLNALNDSIRSYIGKSYIGFSEAEKLLELREIRVFKRVLEHLIKSNPITKNRVSLEIVDV